VLLADDNAVNRLVGRQILESLGHRVDVAEDGARALELTAERSYDVIVMDVEMPRVDGLEATRKLRERGCESPILGFTAHSDVASTQRCGAAGMNAVLHKPLSLEKLEIALGHIMSGRFGWREARERARAASPTVEPTSRTAEHATPDAASGVPSASELHAPAAKLLSFDDLRGRVGGDEEIAREILVATLADSAQLMRDIESALGRGDYETLRRVAHSLKGCVANVSAESLVVQALVVETAAKARDERACLEHVPRLRATFDRVYEAMTRAVGLPSTPNPGRQRPPNGTQLLRRLPSDGLVPRPRLTHDPGVPEEVWRHAPRNPPRSCTPFRKSQT
jgi:CheY-like chemotaxis protein